MYIYCDLKWSQGIPCDLKPKRVSEILKLKMDLFMLIYVVLYILIKIKV